MTDAITIKNMHKLDISEVVGSIELPTSVYGNRSITLETLGQYLGTGGGGSGEVTKVEFDKEVTDRKAADTLIQAEIADLDNRVNTLESNPIQLKTINSESLVGTGNIKLPTQADVVSTADSKVNAYKATVDVELGTIKTNITTLDTSVSDLNTKTASLDAGQLTLTTNLAQEVSNRTSADTALGVRITNLDTKVTATDTKIQTLETETTDLDTRVTELEASSGKTLKTINGESLVGTGDIDLPTATEVSAIASAEVETYKRAVDPKIETLEDDVAALETSDAAQTVKIADNTARIVTLENKTHSDEHVKMTASGVAGYLADFVDGSTLINSNNKLVVKGIDGVQTTIGELNYLQGATSNIQAQINALTGVGEFKGAKNTKAELDAVTGAVNGDMWIVLADESFGGVSVLYAYNGTWVSLGEFKAEVRDFTTNPLDLATEATGVLPLAHIPTGNTATTVALGNHTHANATTTAAGFMSTADKTKLNAIAAEATKNDTDASLRDRSTHTGSQSFTTLNDVAAVDQIPSLDAAKITTGMFAVERIPVGTTETTVASGNHQHAEATEALAGFLSAADKMKLNKVNPQTTDSPVINIGDPPSQEEIQSGFDKILAALEKVGLFTNNTHLFMNGEQGVWFDPNDLSTLFQDAAGTIPVTAAGQPVGLMMDKSGNGNHAKQTVNEHRPILQKNANTGAYFLHFDGLGDFFVTDDIDFSVTSEISMFTAVRNLSTSRVVVMETSLNPGTYDGSFGMYVDPGNRYVSYSRGTQIIAATITAQRDYSVVLSQYSLTAPFVTIKDQGTTATNTAAQGGTTYFKHPLYIGKRGGNVTYSAMTADFYGALIVSRLTVLNENNKTMSALNLKMENLG